MLYVTLALAIAGFLALVIYWPKVDGGEWFTLPANRSGQLLYHIPQQMALEEEMSCIVRIAFDSVDLVRDLSLSDVKIEEIRTSSKMKVELVDAQSEPVFQIRNVLGDDEQFIEEGDYTEWIFGVTPLVAGTHQLLLKVTVLKKIDGEYVPKNLSFSKEIEIVTDDLAPTEMTFENSGQIIAEASAEALVQTVEQERQRREEEGSNDIEELLRKDDAIWGELVSSPNKGASSVDLELDLIQVYFPYNSTTLISDDKLEAILSTLVKGIASTNLKLLLVGHTDDQGTSAYNLQLGRQRAAAVRTKLVELGLESERVQISSKGEAQPVAPNATETGRAQNRRVEIRLLKN
jgi:outer membrane protein OmpA-like peptidoglycan-associated protein